jgi:hypothetical protein
MTESTYCREFGNGGIQAVAVVIMVIFGPSSI